MLKQYSTYHEDLNVLLSKGEVCYLSLLRKRACSFNLKTGIQVLSYLPGMSSACQAKLEFRYHLGWMQRKVACEILYHQFL